MLGAFYFYKRSSTPIPKLELQHITQQSQAETLTIEDAQAIVKLWIKESNAAPLNITGSLESDLPKGLPVRVKGAIFRYDAEKKQLLVSGLVRYDIKTLSKYPVLWDRLVRIGQREYTTMMYGEAQFELLREPLFDLNPDVLLLTKTYTAPITNGKNLQIQIGWLLSDADYWFVNRFNEINAKTEEELIKEAPGINEFMLKNRPKSW
ncbi:MAG: hypothetical protein JWN37_93 [Candidatus Nomurabacteria bacterium]|nr:hypothetical protein [Candidatus Nomurabacteria bacterium]